MVHATLSRPARRRVTRAALKQQVLDFLVEALPEGWISQPLASGPVRGPAPGGAGGRAAIGAGDGLVISPRGRCHFLFLRAPADRWWDGDLRTVPAEAFSAKDAQLARKLRAAGHQTRVIRCDQDLNRALKAWGCPLTRQANFLPAQRATGAMGPACGSSRRPTLRLSSLGRRSDG
jgi:hypothetical protein